MRFKSSLCGTAIPQVHACTTESTLDDYFFLLYLPPTATLVKAPSRLQLLHYFWLLAGNPAHLPSSLIVYSTFRSHFRLVFKGVGSCHPSAQDPPTAPTSLGEASQVLTTIHVTWRSRPHLHPSPSLPDLSCCPPPGPLISRRIGALKHPGRTRPRHRGTHPASAPPPLPFPAPRTSLLSVILRDLQPQLLQVVTQLSTSRVAFPDHFL